jgi:PAS domain S-box-containing protein/diguanylate cyclase (GGDEF)-like protein
MSLNEFTYKNILDNLYEGVYFVDENRVITYWNKGAEKISGYKAEEVVGSRCSDNILRHVDDKGCHLCEGLCPMLASMKDGEAKEKNVYMLHKEGYRLPVVVRAMPLYDDVGNVLGSVEIFADNTKQKQQEDKMKQLAKLAFNDELTGVNNKRYGEMKLATLIAEVKAQGIDAAVLVIELRQIVKDRVVYGADIDSDTLKIVAMTMQGNMPEGDTICRWGKNSFLLVLRNYRKSTLLLFADKLKSLINQSKFTSSFKGEKLYIAIGGTEIMGIDKAESITDRAQRNAQSSLELASSKIIIDPQK